MRQDADRRLTNVKMTGEKAGMKQNKEDFLTGVGAVDAEHVVLLDLTDQVGALLADENMLFKCCLLYTSDAADD